MKIEFKTFIMMSLFPISVVLGQQRNITGKITDSAGQPLAGVTISIKGSKTSVTTSDRQGIYQIKADQNDILSFSLIGFTSQNETVTAKNNFNIILQSDEKNIDEVVVVGYGTQKKGNLTGSISTIDNSKLEHRPNLSTSAALQGLAPGVTVTSQTGAPGADAGQIRIRGISSFGGSDSSPLVIIDGVAGSLDNIDYNQIESMSVLKDAASASIYGSRAANGVILITTKRAKDRLTVNYKGYTGFQKPTALPKVSDGFTLMRMINEANINDGNQITYTDADIEEFKKLYEADPSNFDWQDAIMTRSGFTQNHFLGLMANTGIIKVAPSFSYATQDGLIENTGFTRYAFRNNMDITPSEKFNIKIDLSVTNKNRQQIASEGTIWNYFGRMPTNLPIRHPNGMWAEGWVKNNPVAFIEEGGNRKTNNLEFYGNLSLNYKPVEWLNLVGTVAPRYETRNRHTFTKSVNVYDINGVSQGAANTFTDLEETANRAFFGNYFFTATAEKRYNSHDFKLMLGTSRESFNEKFLMGYRRDFIYDDYEVLDIGADNATKNNRGTIDEWLLVSTFGRFNYTFKNRYLLEANIRYDGSSRFSKGNKWAAFPSFSAGWKINEEPFMQAINQTVNQLKLRTSWGKLGNQNIGNTYYPFVSALEVGSISMNNQIRPIATQTKMANADLKWEETTIYGAGLDAVLFNNWSFTFDWYNKTTNGILLTLPIPLIHGQSAPFQNAGKVENKGWEFSTRYDKSFNDLNVGLGFNISDVKNKIIDMKETTIGTFLRQQTGYSINSIYGYIADGYYQSTDEIKNGPTQFGTLQPGDIKYKDIAGAFDNNGNPIADGKIDDNDKVIIGNTVPRYTYGFNVDLGYKGFVFSAFIQGVGKANGYLNSHYVVPLANASAVKPWQEDYWTAQNPNASLPRLSHTSTNNTQNSTFWMKDASYVRLKNVQLGYKLPAQWLNKLKIAGAFVYVNGQNLFTKTNFYEGYDPEINYDAGAGEGISLGAGNYYPQVKVYTFGLDLKF